MTQNDQHLTELIDLIQRVQDKRRSMAQLNPLQIMVDIHSEESELISQRFLLTDVLDPVKMQVNLINLNQLKARKILRDHSLDGCSLESMANAKIPYLMILGWSDLAISMIYQTRSNGLYGHQPTQIFCIQDERSPSDQDLSNAFPTKQETDSYQQTLQVLDLNIIPVEHFKKKLIKGWQNDSISQLTILVCGSDHDQVIHQAIEWELKHPWIHSPHKDEKSSLILELPDHSNYRSVLNQSMQSSIFVLAPSRHEIMQSLDSLDELPKKAHTGYLQMLESWNARHKLADGRYQSSSHNHWEDLPYCCKNWNRSTVDHLQIKMRLLANEYARPHPKFHENGRLIEIDESLKTELLEMIQAYSQTKDLRETEYAEKLNQSSKLKVLEQFAKLEHDRWSSERYIQGWRYNPDRVESHKLHSSLVEYKKLSHKEKIKDRNNVIAQLNGQIQQL